MAVKAKRILLKISGEALMGPREFGLDSETLNRISDEIASLYRKKVEVAVVVGGGNIFRGLQESASRGMDRVTADHMGMLATVINSLSVQDVLERKKIPTRVLSAIRMDQVAEPYIRRRAVRHLEKKRVVIFGGGTGNPYFTTDTAGVLRAIEIKADLIIKATKVDGVYDRDPVKYKNAKKFDTISFKEAIRRKLKIMDATAFTLCAENHLPIMVVNLRKKGNLLKAVEGKKVGSIVKE